MEFDPKGFFSFRPDGESRKNAFWTQLDNLDQQGCLRCLEKPTQNGGMKSTLWNSIPRVFFRFAPMRKVEKTRFQHNWTIFVNLDFCPPLKSPPKMVVWNRPRGIQSQRGFFVSPRGGKSKERFLNPIGRPSSTRVFALLGKAYPKLWYETDLVELDPKGFFSFRRDWESRKNAFWNQLDDLRQRGFLRCLEKPTQNGGMKPTSWNSIPRVFLRFAPMGKVEKMRFQRNWTTFVKKGFFAAWKSPPKMVVWSRPRGLRSQGCFFVSPRWGKSKKRVFNTIGRPSSTRLFALLGKPTQNGGMKPTSWNSIPRGFCRFAPIGKVEKTLFEHNWTTFVKNDFSAAWKRQPIMVVWNRPRGIRSQRSFSVSPWWGKSKKRIFNRIGRPSSTRLFCCLEKPIQNGGIKPTSWNSTPRVFFRFAPMRKVEKRFFQPNWRTFVNKGFCAAWKSLPKMVVWNRPRGIQSQGFFFVSPRWGKSKKRFLNTIGRPSSTTIFPLLGKAHPKWLYQTYLVEFDPKGVFSFESLQNKGAVVHSAA